MLQQPTLANMPAPVEPTPAPDFSDEIDGKWGNLWSDVTASSMFARVSDANWWAPESVEVEMTEVSNFMDYGDDGLLSAAGVYNVYQSSWTFPRGAFNLADMKDRNHALCAVRSNGMEPDSDWLPAEEAARFAELTLAMQYQPALFARIVAPEILRGWADDGRPDIYYTPDKLEREMGLARTWYNWSYARRGECLHSYYGGSDDTQLYPSLRAAMQAVGMTRDALNPGEWGQRDWDDDGPVEWGKACNDTSALVYPRERHIRYVAAACGQAIIRHERHTAGVLLKHLRKLAGVLDADYEYSAERPDWWEGSDTLAALVGYAQLVPENEV